MDRLLKSASLLVTALILVLAPRVSADQVDHFALTEKLHANLISLPTPVVETRTLEVAPFRTAASFSSVVTAEFPERTETSTSGTDARWSVTDETTFFRTQTYVDPSRGTALTYLPGNRSFEGWGHLKAVNTSNPAIATPEPPALVLLLVGLAAAATVFGLKKGAQ